LIRVFEPKLTTSDKISVLNSLIKNQISGSSEFVERFEVQFAKICNRKYGVAVSNGSVALDIAFQCLNLKKEDEVILPSHTIISCLSAVMRTGAIPKFCDVDSLSWNMTLEGVKKVVSENTKAIIMVHTYGLPSEAKAIGDFCKKNNIILIEDAAEAHGQHENNLICGSFGLVSTFSFYANKHITTGEGGMLLTNDEEIYNLAKRMRNLDFSQERFKHQNLFWNYRLSGIQASLGLSQIRNLDMVINKKIDQGNYYQELLCDSEDLFQLPLKEHNNSLNHYWVFGVLLRKKNIRDKVANDLFKSGIETRPFFWPLHLQPLIDKNQDSDIDLPVSENLGRNGLYIPIGQHLNNKKQKYISEKLKEIVRKY
tara:strand:- start:12007 stop:13113 length:1107 start_codon:yes stop_codon:yes gene_type:complete